MASSAPEDRPPHAVCMPYPAQGHVTPMFKLAKLLHARGFHITFVNTEYNGLPYYFVLWEESDVNINLCSIISLNALPS
ncbi:hypothetical protein EJB05_37051, partial [Eragrostis curvula]